MDKKPVVFIVDNDKAIRDGIADIVLEIGLGAQTFESAEDFLAAYDPEQPGCLVLDIRMPGMSGLELQEKMANDEINLPIIIITGHGDIPMSVETMKKGAVDFIEKPFREQVLWDSIKKAIARDAKSRDNHTMRRGLKAKLSLLSGREREVMELMMDGKVDKQIAQKLNITARAVAFHRTHILDKMEVGSAVELARMLP